MKKKSFLGFVVLAVLLVGMAWAGDQVVVTPTGRKYHRPDCRTLHKEVRWMSIEEAQALGYQPCKVCMPR